MIFIWFLDNKSEEVIIRIGIVGLVVVTEREDLVLGQQDTGRRKWAIHVLFRVLVRENRDERIRNPIRGKWSNKIWVDIEKLWNNGGLSKSLLEYIWFWLTFNQCCDQIISSYENLWLEFTLSFMALWYIGIPQVFCRHE